MWGRGDSSPIDFEVENWAFDGGFSEDYKFGFGGIKGNFICK